MAVRSTARGANRVGELSIGGVAAGLEHALSGGYNGGDVPEGFDAYWHRESIFKAHQLWFELLDRFTFPVVVLAAYNALKEGIADGN